MRCAYCGYKNRAGMLFCEDCGHLLFDQATLPTKKLPDERDGATLVAERAILLHIRGGDDPIPLQRPARIVLGRLDTTTPNELPDIDLTPYGAPDKGVSRRHALLDTLMTPVLVDMGSANGTYVNGQKLAPNLPCELHDGDEIRLGKLVARIIMK